MTPRCYITTRYSTCQSHPHPSLTHTQIVLVQPSLPPTQSLPPTPPAHPNHLSAPFPPTSKTLNRCTHPSLSLQHAEKHSCLTSFHTHTHTHTHTHARTIPNPTTPKMLVLVRFSLFLSRFRFYSSILLLFYSCALLLLCSCALVLFCSCALLLFCSSTLLLFCSFH